ncbi:hypothetical protein ASPZODRAFT_139247 [Penicilliopsis zonata CBS 506.65]|uniref:Uncharacterized protein n=1 Tax=Penicilliopsis zonata CBS 506.65 TaxID=1073090 RepID=A0A1L9SS42_9EURO|nr:hypothetical protein ASPZODRAFT_139247 [Penicilliopsis zonata CBS 506.65]OJJ49901.1 hypothetical protein ASPZODRAFT_139247 [Penicilliopsis zonata CBS 506.65]
MESARTISELKSAFIRGQVRILSEGLEPPEGWRNYASESNEGDLSDKAVDDALQKLNAAVKQHNRVVYSSQAVHHVAQQISSLYWASATQENQSLSSNMGVEKTMDLTNHLNIRKLPLELEDPAATEEERSRLRYQQARERLMELDERRQERQRRLSQLQQLKHLVEPFRSPQENIQPNLVTRDGELARELDKMRMLVARAAGRIGQQPPKKHGQPDSVSRILSSEQKITAVLDLMDIISELTVVQDEDIIWNPIQPNTGDIVQVSFTLTMDEDQSRTDHIEFSGRSSPASESPSLDPFGHGVATLPGNISSTGQLHDQGENSVQQTAIIEGLQEVPSSPKPSFVRGHRRRSTHVSPRDLESFRKEVLGLQEPCRDYDFDSPDTLRLNPSHDPQLQDLNSAFERAAMSLNNGGGMPSNGPGAGMFSGFMDNANNPNMVNMPRPNMSPIMPHSPSQANGGGMAGVNVSGMPMNAGHQMDLNHLYEMVLDLSEVLKNNREVTKSIVSSAEDIMKRANSEGASPTLQQVNGEINGARISELERAVAKEKRLVETLKREQAENTKLIGEYEAAVGVMVEQIRNYCHNNNMHFLSQKRHYNNLLQAERDAHLSSRLDRDYWHEQTMKCAEMIRTAYRLRCEEEEPYIRVISGLQNEVRAYRNALGMEPEKPEEEYGWEILKDTPPSVE